MKAPGSHQLHGTIWALGSSYVSFLKRLLRHHLFVDAVGSCRERRESMAMVGNSYRAP